MTPKSRTESSPALLIVGLSIGAILAIGIATFIIIRPSWGQTNRATILSMKAEADALAAHDKPKQAYFKYQQLLDFVGKREVGESDIQEALTAAKTSSDREHALAAPIIAREIAEAKAKEEERQRQERAFQLAQQAQKDLVERQRLAAESARQDQLRRNAIAAAAKVRAAAEPGRVINERQNRLTRFHASPQCATLRHQADDIVRTLSSTIAAEDSAYRSIDERCAAARDLLAIYVRVRGAVDGVEVGREVNRIIADATVDAVGDESAIRSIYRHDEAFLHLLGTWGKVLAVQNPRISADYARISSEVTLSLAGDDSAIRAISRYSGASTKMLQVVVAAEGHDVAASAIVSSANSDNALDTSAWQVAMRNCEANMDLLLTMFPEEHEVDSKRIRASAADATLADDSALRAQSQYMQGIVEALHSLISYE